MDNTSTFSNICNFDSIECNGRIKPITYNTKIPKSTKLIISVGMYLCQIHYNQFILNETRNINYNKSCEHPKHDEYKNQSKNTKKKSSKLNLKKVPKRLIEVLELNESSEICSMCRNKTDKDSEYLQNEKYKAPIPIKKNNLNDNDNLQDESIETIQDELIEAIQDESIEVIQNESIEVIQNESIETKQIKTCQHPKHDEYLNQSKNTSKQFSLQKVPTRLIKVLELDELAMICSMCKKKTDKDSQYLQTEEYKAPISRKNNNDNISKIGNYTYLFRKDILYTGEELQQFESDYQEIMTQLKISSEIKLSSKIIKMSNILYNNQHRLNLKPIYDPIAFKTMLETADKDLIGFFDELYVGTNPNTKSETTNNNNKKKLVSLCYFLASINNKYINGIKVDIGSYLETSGASSSSIDTLANIGVSVTRKTVNRKKNFISNEHQQTVDNYCLQNIENMFILNIDDYHNIHRRNQPTLLQTHNIYHFVTILLNTNTKIPKIPFYSLNNFSIHNPKGIDPGLIINNIKNNFMNQLVLKDYIECLDYVFKAFERLENIEENYLNNFIIPVIADWPGQVNIRRAITLRIKKGINSGVLEQVLNLIPMIGPLHVSLNSREILFKTYHFFFEMLYHNLFGDKKILSQKLKQTVINLILHLTYHGWKNIRDIVTKRFGNLKDAEYQMMIDLLDNSIPLTLDIYAILFRSGFFEGYLESTVKIWILVQRLRRHNYNKAPLMFLSDVFYWTSKNHPIINILKNNLPIFNDYFVENFHNSLRHQTAESNSELQIIQKAKIIDAERNNNPFKNSFVNLRNPAKSQIKELKSLEKKVSLFLFSIFDKIHQNIGNTKQINNDRYPKFYLPSFDIEVDVKVLPLGWNTQKIPADDKFCDANNCLLSNSIDLSNGIVLLCGHSFHKECLSTLYDDKYCRHSLKENEIPLFEKENNNDDENDEEENIENILERTECDVENQYDIMYQQWLNYNDI
ncbi:uncharacterized protein OCT59_007302 [Rhizophagus irregularis]|uniref:uncharacterized protein n=1 Tax=Rhizophagus irregularis TaxID=588596 RepID=UPI0033279EAA|nr:hypothetical protein OCT59_007302 [Rhizophagus irregularis]